MVLFIDCGSEKSPEIARIIHETGKAVYGVKLENLAGIPETNYSHLIISGAPILLTEEDPTPYLEQFAFLTSIEIPVLGICFGHQVLGMVHGSDVYSCKEDRDWQTVEIKTPSELFEPKAEKVEMMEDHCEAITLPENFELIASSSTCEVEAMKHKTKPLYGVQFHPEVSDDQGEIMIRSFLFNC